MSDDPAQKYTPDEAEEILRRALQRQNDAGLSRDDLIAAAREVGVSEAALVNAAEEVEQGRVERDVTARLKLEKRASLVRHVSTYAMVSVALFLLNLATNMVTVTDQVPRWWSLFPLVMWGLAVATHAGLSLRDAEPDAEDVRREVAREAHEASERAREDARRASAADEPPGAGAMLSRLDEVLRPAQGAPEAGVRVQVEAPREVDLPRPTETQTEGPTGDVDELERRES